MKFEEYWEALMLLKPIRENQKVIMTKEQFKSMLKKAYEKGASQKSVFESIFGKL